MPAFRNAALGLLLGAAALLASPANAHALGLPRPAAPTAPTTLTTSAGLLTVTYDDGAGHAQAYALTCDESDPAANPADAADPADPADPGAPAATNPATDPTDACAHLEALGGPLPAVPPGEVCSMLYGGPQTATVRGTWHGRVVDETYRRTNGCEVSRWARMTPALPDPASAAAAPAGAVTYATPRPYITQHPVR